MLDFFASVMDMLGEQIYEQLGREELIRLQNNTLLRMGANGKAEGKDAKNL